MKKLIYIVAILLTACTIPTEQTKQIDSTNHPQRTILPKVEPEISFLRIIGIGYTGSQIYYPVLLVTVQPKDTTYRISNQIGKGYEQILFTPPKKILSLTFRAELDEFEAFKFKSIIVNDKRINSLDGWGIKEDSLINPHENGKFVLERWGFIKFENI